MLKDFYLGVKFSFSYFSILPIKFNKTDDLSNNRVLAFMLYSLPLVGIVLSLISIVLFKSLMDTNIYLASILASVVYTLLYGFIHTEAICDVVDAIYAKHSGKDPYKIIKEPTVGAIGVLYCVAFYILKIAFLSTLFFNNLFVEFIFVSIISRVSIVSLIYFNEYKSSFIVQLKSEFFKNYFLYFIGFYSLLFFYSIDILLMAVVAVSLAILISLYLKKRLGFLNGDTLGVSLEILELFLYFVLIFFIV